MSQRGLFEQDLNRWDRNRHQNGQRSGIRARANLSPILGQFNGGYVGQAKYKDFETDVREPYLDGIYKVDLYDTVIPAVGEGWKQ